MEQRPSLLPGPLLHAKSHGTKRLAVQQRRIDRGRQRRDHVARAVLVQHLDDVGTSDGLRGVVAEEKRNALGDLFEAIDRGDRHRQERLDVRERSVTGAPQESSRLEEARALGGNPRGRRHLHVVPVHPRELLGIEYSGAVTDVLQREAPRELVHRHQLRIFLRLAAARAR